MNTLMEFISQPWSWYVGGILIGLMVPLLLLYGNKQFGISSSMRHVCAAVLPTKIEFFNYNWREHQWNLLLVGGIVLGGFIGAKVIGHPESIAISESTRTDLSQLGITDFTGYIPREIFSIEGLLTLPGIMLMLVGGFLIGFGTRYANGCTSGHSITGMALLSWGSLVATISFMLGGIFITHLVLPLILK